MESSTKPLFCVSCGERLDEDALFCGHCGTRVGDGPSPTKTSPLQGMSLPKTNLSQHDMLFYGILASYAMMALLVFAAWIRLGDFGGIGNMIGGYGIKTRYSLFALAEMMEMLNAFSRDSSITLVATIIRIIGFAALGINAFAAFMVFSKKPATKTMLTVAVAVNTVIFLLVALGIFLTNAEAGMTAIKMTFVPYFILIMSYVNRFVLFKKLTA